MKQKIAVIIVAFLCAILLCTPALAASRVPEMELNVALRPDGSAHITQVWTTDTDEGTEFYLGCRDSGYLTITDFSVSDQNGPYAYVEDWDVDASFEEKANRCGILETGEGVELCWGISEYGENRYTIEYVLHDLVGSYSDADGFNHRFVDEMSFFPTDVALTIRNEDGIAVDFVTEGDFPKYGNDDDRADEIGVWLLRTFLEMIKKRHTYRNSEATTSILTITSNVVYGKYTGALPDGRAAFTPFAPGANPSYGAEQNGLLASLNSVAKLPYHWALDGISNTQTINPEALGHSEEERKENLVQVMDGYFDQGAHHLNVNVFGKEKLLDAMEHPEKEEYANFTIRVSGYAVKFIDLTREQQMDVISRTCHAAL